MRLLCGERTNMPLLVDAERLEERARRRPNDSAVKQCQSPLGHVEHMLLSLQKKLEYLTAIVGQHLRENDHEAQTSHVQDGLRAERPLAFVSNCDTGAQRVRSLQHDDKTNNVKQGNAFSDAENSSHAASATTRTTFSGYMSPDYSFQLARDKLLRESDRVNDRGRRSNITCADQKLCDGLSHSIPDTIEGSASQSSGRHAGPSSTFTCLVELPLRIPLVEALRLIDMYEQLVGERYPLLEVACLKEKAETWYAWAVGFSAGTDDPPKSCPLDEDDSLITLLVICITLAAEVAFAKPIDSEELYYTLEKSIQSRTLSPVSSMKDIIIILLAAHYHYFRDIVRTSWRLCGIAGSMMMELGLHDAEVVKNVLGSDQERAEAAVIAGAVITLDHQYSALVGLPTRYKTASFSTELLSAVHTPYLKAMIPFLHISEMVSTMIADALECGSFDDGDAFELVNFQIEQWRRKALSNHAPILLQRAYCSHDKLPSWSLLLYLRANSVKNMLVRLFFVLSGPRSAAERQVKPALDLISDSVETLVELDEHTTFYRNQHAHFQHMLSGACALLFLVVTYIERNPTAGCIGQFDTVAKIRQVFESAVALSRAYSGIFTAAETLLRRLEDMAPILDRLSNRSKELNSDPTNPSQSVRSPVAQTKQDSGSTGQEPQFVDSVHRESAVADSTNRMQLPLHDCNAFFTPGMVERMPWPDPSLSCAKSNFAPMRQPYNNAAAASFIDPMSSIAPVSMARWLTTNADGIVAPVQQWSLDGGEDHFNSWSNT
ncbi:hypothetical protein CB0940_11045 [Cercospora beticola]|uniref:Transcription factor domain-containing protein n=1 Tax=Cercospora beticola TaxID=122368 RepID=A0A2G5HD97_CERBT|nr:hypothetical protein CB0940_11045 [Cercospora beticola]PIA90520.1 hypothetical protein CB0940_11045 [Cercospora beticola]WPB07872.1 hypothetical protein RHO25_012536 [Cercospora beticola]